MLFHEMIVTSNLQRSRLLAHLFKLFASELIVEIFKLVRWKSESSFLSVLSEYLTQKLLFIPRLLITKKLNYQLNPFNDARLSIRGSNEKKMPPWLYQLKSLPNGIYNLKIWVRTFLNGVFLDFLDLKVDKLWDTFLDTWHVPRGFWRYHVKALE